jgi:hypothetical protein
MSSSRTSLGSQLPGPSIATRSNDALHESRQSGSSVCMADCFGILAHTGADSEIGLVHKMCRTSGKVSEVVDGANLFQGQQNEAGRHQEPDLAQAAALEQ